MNFFETRSASSTSSASSSSEGNSSSEDRSDQGAAKRKRESTPEERDCQRALSSEFFVGDREEEDREFALDGSAYEGPPERKNERDCSGRVRKFPHVEGRFASLVYIPIHLDVACQTQLHGILSEIGTGVRREVHSLLPDTHASAEEAAEGFLHVSLSRSFSITFDEIETLLSLLRKKLKKMPNDAEMKFAKLTCFTPPERDRTFIACQITESLDPLLMAVKQVDQVLLLHRKQPFYEDPQLHVSIGWTPGDLKDALKPILENLDLSPLQWSQAVSSIMCRIGQKNHIVWEPPTPSVNPGTR